MSSSLLPSPGEIHTTLCSHAYTHKTENVHLSTPHKHIGAYMWTCTHKYTGFSDVTFFSPSMHGACKI